MTKLDLIREVVEERIDFCFRALPQRTDITINQSKYRELMAMISCYKYILEKIKEINETQALDQPIKEPLIHGN